MALVEQYQKVLEEYSYILEHPRVVSFVDFFSEFIPRAVKTKWDERKVKRLLKSSIQKLPGKIVIVVDGGSKRKEIEGYKKGIASWQIFYTDIPDHKPHENPNITGIMAYRVLQFLRTPRVSVISEWGLEADDLILFFAEMRAIEGKFSRIVSRDKDLHAAFLLNHFLFPPPPGKISIDNSRKSDINVLYEEILKKISGYDSDMPDAKKNLKHFREKYPTAKELAKGIARGEIPQFLALFAALQLSQSLPPINGLQQEV